MWNLGSHTRDGTHTPCTGRRSLSCWTTREVPLNDLSVHVFPTLGFGFSKNCQVTIFFWTSKTPRHLLLRRYHPVTFHSPNHRHLPPGWIHFGQAPKLSCYIPDLVTNSVYFPKPISFRILTWVRQVKHFVWINFGCQAHTVFSMVI